MPMKGLRICVGKAAGFEATTGEACARTPVLRRRSGSFVFLLGLLQLICAQVRAGFFQQAALGGGTRMALKLGRLA